MTVDIQIVQEKSARTVLALASALTALVMLPAAATIVEYHQDFEESAGGFSRHPLMDTNSWEHGESSRTWAQGNRMWATSLDENYGPEEDSAIRSPKIDLSGVEEGRVCYLGWWQYVDVEPHHDSITVEASGDGGVSWNVLYSASHGFPESWQYVRCHIPKDLVTDSVYLRYRIQSDETGQQYGWSVDDIMIVSVPNHEQIYEESFEEDDGQFAAAGTQSTWEWGRCSSNRNYYPDEAANGKKAWGTDLDDVHAHLEDSTLTSPVINMPNEHDGRDLLVSWDQYLLLDEATFTVELKTGDQPWRVLFESEKSYIGQHWDWTYAVLPCEEIGDDIQLRFHLHALDDWYVHGGAYIDEIQVLVVPRINVEANDDQNLPVGQADTVNLGDALTAINAHECIAIRFDHQPAHGTILWHEKTVLPDEVIPAWKIADLVYRPEPTFVGNDEVDWREQDFFNGWSEPAALQATVQDRDAPPVVKQTDPAIVIDEDDDPGTISLSELFLDPDNPDSTENIDFTIVEDSCNDFLDVELRNGSLAYTPELDRNGNGSVVIQARLNGEEVTTQVHFDVEPVNDPPRLEETKMICDLEAKSISVHSGTWIDPDESDTSDRSCRYEWTIGGRPRTDVTTSQIDMTTYPEAETFLCRVTPRDAYDDGESVMVGALVYNLNPGWNLLGLPLQPDAGQFASLTELCWTPFYIWSNNLYVSTETPPKNTAFWAYAKDTDRISITGRPSSESNIPTDRWALVPMPTTAEGMDLSEKLPGVRCWWWDSIKQIYQPDGLLHVNRGYWIQ